MIRSEPAGTVASFQNSSASLRSASGWLERNSRLSGSSSRTTTPIASVVPVFLTTIWSVVIWLRFRTCGPMTSTVRATDCRPSGSFSGGSTKGSIAARPMSRRPPGQAPRWQADRGPLIGDRPPSTPRAVVSSTGDLRPLNLEGRRGGIRRRAVAGRRGGNGRSVGFVRGRHRRRGRQRLGGQRRGHRPGRKPAASEGAGAGSLGQHGRDSRTRAGPVPTRREQ